MEILKTILVFVFVLGLSFTAVCFPLERLWKNHKAVLVVSAVFAVLFALFVGSTGL